jgi:hydroxymethylbilane synthase
MLPAVGQACLAVEVRADDADAVELVRSIDHEESHLAARAERAFLARLGAGCRLPVGAWATPPVNDMIKMYGMIAVGSPPRMLRYGDHWRRHGDQWRPADAEAAGDRLAAALIAQAGGDFMDAAS